MVAVPGEERMDQLLVRMAIWLRRPPSRRTIQVALVVLAVAAVLVGLEAAGLWPEWATAERTGRHGVRLPGGS